MGGSIARGGFGIGDFEGVLWVDGTIAGGFDANFLIGVADECVVFIDAFFLVFRSITRIAISAALGECIGVGDAIARNGAIFIDTARLIGTLPSRVFALLAKLNARFIGRTFGHDFAIFAFFFFGRLGGFFGAIDDAIFAIFARSFASIALNLIAMADDGVVSVGSTFAIAIGIGASGIDLEFFHASAAFADFAIDTKRIDELVIFTFFDFFRIVFVANGDRTFGVGIDRFASVIGARFAVATRGFGQCAVCTFIERVGVFARIGSAFIVGIDGFTSVIGARFAYATFDLGRLAIFALQ